MSATAWPVVLLVLSAAAVIGWPAGGVRARYRDLFRSGQPTTPDPTARPRYVRHVPRFRLPGPIRATGRRPSGGPPTRRDPSRPAGGSEEPDLLVPGGRDGSLRAAATLLADRGVPSGTATGTAGQVDDADRGSTRRWAVSPGRGVLLGAAVGATGGGLVAGPVAAVVAAAYAALGVRALLRRRATRSADRLWRHRLDQLGALAADLRAGLPAPVDRPERSAAELVGLDRIDRLTRSATRLADRTGAPLAELVERIEADLRAMDRGLAAAAAQAAGAQATAWLLAGLPLGGIALGYGIGVDPLRVLLHTPIGAGCVVAATVLQVVGLLWAERLGATPGRAV
ncbi:tight adherence protein B [Micromonospora pallida]|uniref:Tight adherence protein B n=1 Tax=Micromonospora pallida TaxID=145854 RepID=A0A1C6T719_9ACTN|nr:hypothetical protein [Micromonospora pallida]SCL37568.1 tight adherence protein B [Micromonospora pallida]